MIRVVLVCAERTGSNLLTGLLNSPPDFLFAGELFNRTMINNAVNPGISTEWWPGIQGLRLTDPKEFLKRFWRESEKKHKVSGFKLMYYHGKDFPVALDIIQREKAVRIIHLRRRNLLRRYLSLQQAQKSQIWVTTIDSPNVPVTQLRLEPEDVIKDIKSTQESEKYYSNLFLHHQVLNIWYEDLANAPEKIGKIALNFVGLPSHHSLFVKHRKTGIESLEAAISNFNELKSALNMYLSYFSETS